MSTHGRGQVGAGFTAYQRDPYLAQAGGGNASAQLVGGFGIDTEGLGNREGGALGPGGDGAGGSVRGERVAGRVENQRIDGIEIVGERQVIELVGKAQQRTSRERMQVSRQPAVGTLGHIHHWRPCRHTPREGEQVDQNCRKGRISGLRNGSRAAARRLPGQRGNPDFPGQATGCQVPSWLRQAVPLAVWGWPSM